MKNKLSQLIIHIRINGRNGHILNASKTIPSYVLNGHHVNILGTMHKALSQHGHKHCILNFVEIYICCNNN